MFYRVLGCMKNYIKSEDDWVISGISRLNAPPEEMLSGMSSQFYYGTQVEFRPQLLVVAAMKE